MALILGNTAGSAADFAPAGSAQAGGQALDALQPAAETSAQQPDAQSSDADEAEENAAPEVGDVTVEKPGDDIRVATVHAGLTGSSEEDLLEQLSGGMNQQARSLAEMAQLNRPDVLLVTGVTSSGSDRVAESLRTKYLGVGQNGQGGLDYPYAYAGPSNSGAESGADLDGDGVVGGPGDSVGYGDHPGQHGMILFSAYPIDEGAVRTFQDFLWEDLPENDLADDQYSSLERSVLSLTSSALWDVPIQVDEGRQSERTVHVVASAIARPESPDDVDLARGDDERRMISDYLSDRAWYLTDDEGESAPGTGCDFVFMGEPATQYVLPGEEQEDLDPLLSADALQDPQPRAITAEPLSAREERSGGTHENATREVDGGMDVRSALILPAAGLDVGDSGVFWPAEDEYGADLVSPDSTKALGDRLVWLDLAAR